MCKEAIIAYFELIFQNFPRGTGEYHIKVSYIVGVLYSVV
jgi:hypothetical protein